MTYLIISVKEQNKATNIKLDAFIIAKLYTPKMLFFIEVTKFPVAKSRIQYLGYITFLSFLLHLLQHLLPFVLAVVFSDFFGVQVLADFHL